MAVQAFCDIVASRMAGCTNEGLSLLCSGGYIVCAMGVVQLRVPAEKRSDGKKYATRRRHTFLKAWALTNIDVVFPTIIKYPPIDGMASLQM